MWCVMYILVFLVVVEVGEGVVVGVDEAPGEHGEAPAEAAPATARAERRRRRPALRRRRQAPAVVGLEPGPRGRSEGRRAGVMAAVARRGERVEDVGEERRRRLASRLRWKGVLLNMQHSKGRGNVTSQGTLLQQTR